MAKTIMACVFICDVNNGFYTQFGISNGFASLFNGIYSWLNLHRYSSHKQQRLSACLTLLQALSLYSLNHSMCQLMKKLISYWEIVWEVYEARKLRF